MKCPRCQYENPPGSNFCLGCGTRLGAACGACGNDLPAGSRFCNKCGTPVTGESAAQVRFASPESYTPKHLAERILTSKSALEGERKQVTVLFADLKGSMELLADRDPEEARKILDPVLERMMEAVHRYEGTVNQVMGDGIMALFGAPLAHEDHGVRACCAALRMQDAVRRYGEDVRRAQGFPVRIRVGLNSGEVVVRAIGSDLHMDYTAVGQTTHLAARMEQLADPGGILITASTLGLAEGYLEVRPLGPVPVKGLAEPVEVYEVIGARPVRTRVYAAAARGLSRFVGRDTELEQLRQALERAGHGHVQVVAVVGEAGVGKSRLFYEFTHSHRTESWLRLESGSVSYGKATVYLPVIDLLKGYFKIQDRDDHREIREKVIGKLLALDRVLEPTLPVLLALLDVPVEDAPWQALDPPQRRQRTIDAVKRLLLRESQVQPVLLIFEDLHWIDTETQTLLDSLVDSLPPARLLLLVNYRPEYQHGWTTKTYYSQLRLDALPPASASELLRALLGDDPGLEPLTQMLLKRGNPFFLEESIRTLVETKALVGERGAYRLTRPIEAIQVPATVQAILAARIDRLAAEDKQLLQAAAVIGKDVPLAILQAIAGEPEEALHRGLTRLQAAEFLHETSLFPDPEYTFKHALIHEVTYGTLLQERRRALHARIVEAIETLYPERLSEHVERLAHHALHGEIWEKAFTYLRQAGVKTFARSANREAVACFERALDALRRLPESRERLEHAIDLRLDLRNALMPLEEHGRIADYLREAEAYSHGLGDQLRLGYVLAHRAGHVWFTGNQEQAVDLAQRAYSLASTLGDLRLRIHTTIRLAWAWHGLGDHRRAAEFFRETVASVKEDLVRDRFGHAGLPAVMARCWLAWCLAELGEFDEGVAQGEEGVRRAEMINQPFTRINCSVGLGVVYVRRGDAQKAIAVLERAHQLSKAFLIYSGNRVDPFLGLAYARSGRVDDALRLLEPLVDDRASKSVLLRPIHMAGLSEAYLLAGRLEPANETALEAVDLAQRSRQRSQEAWILWLLGEIASHRDSLKAEAAASNYFQAMALAGELGMRPLVAHCHLGLGKLYRRTGKRQEAQERLGPALTMYREMDMRFWLEQAVAEQKA
jgi:class 3 adenylate cyclase/tetratricopeptide (TPR) repeat protein